MRTSTLTLKAPIASSPLQRPSMPPIGPDHQPAPGVVTKPLRDLLFLHHDSTDFAVVLDQAVRRLRATEPPLERIENVFESVVDVMDGEALPLLQVKEDDYLERIGGVISDTGFLGRPQHGCVDPSPPLPPVTHVSWEGSGNRAPSLGHRVHRCGTPSILPNVGRRLWAPRFHYAAPKR